MKMRRSALLYRRPFFGSSILPMRDIQCRFPLTFFRRARALILNSKSAVISRRNRCTTTRFTSPGSAAVFAPWIFPIRTVPKKSVTTFLNPGKAKRRSKATTFFGAIMAYSTWWTDTTALKFSKARCDKVWTNGIVEHWNIGSMIPSFQSSNIPFPTPGGLYGKKFHDLRWHFGHGFMAQSGWRYELGQRKIVEGIPGRAIGLRPRGASEGSARDLRRRRRRHLSQRGPRR